MSQLGSQPSEFDGNKNLFLMIIKGIFRRYQRWNPVHPTMGIFWGMGIGLGCGVGWGPGFGPEVIGYVGVGCGVGFSVGITLAGIGVGLPQNGLVQIMYNAVGTKNNSFDFVRLHPLAGAKSILDDSLNYATPHVSFLKKETSHRLSRLRTDTRYIERFDLDKLNITVSNQIQSMMECIEAFKDKLWPPGGIS